MIVRVRLGVWVLPKLATVAGWFGKSFEFVLLDENKRVIEGDVLDDDTDIYYVKLCGFSKWEDFNGA